MIRCSSIKNIIEKEIPTSKIGKMQYISESENWIVDLYIAYIPKNLEILEAKGNDKEDIKGAEVKEDINNVYNDIKQKLSKSFNEVDLKIDDTSFFYPNPPKALIKQEENKFYIKTKKELEEELDVDPEREEIIMQDINNLDEGLYVLHDNQNTLEDCYELVRYMYIGIKFQVILK